MSVIIKDFLTACSRIFATKGRRRLLLLVILGIIALTDFFVLGLVRRTFVFYSISEGKTTVEDRMLKRSPSREQDIRRYIEEAILGPVTPDLLPMFPHGTQLGSLLYRDGVVYADFSEEALLPPEEGGEVYKNFQTLYNGIKRNFPYVGNVRFFVNGEAAYDQQSRRFFSEENEKPGLGY